MSFEISWGTNLVSHCVNTLRLEIKNFTTTKIFFYMCL